MYKVQVTDTSAIDALNRLIAFGENPSGALAAIGEGVLLPATRQNFVDSTDPYGVPWAVNSDTTLRSALHRSGKSFTKAGKLSKRGQTYLTNKKPLIGESRSLSTQFAYTVIGNNLVAVTSLMKYAATQHFGAMQGEFGRDSRNHPIPWGNIPARPIFPDETRGLPAGMANGIFDVLREALENAAKG